MAGDDNCNHNGRLRALAFEMSATNERLAAWVYRGLLSMVSIGFIITGWFAVDRLTSIDKKFDQVEIQRAQIYVTVTGLAKNVSDSSNALARLQTLLDDYIRNQERIIQQLSTEQTDHEQRLRQIERPPR